jgi:hypothetical protein
MSKPELSITLLPELLVADMSCGLMWFKARPLFWWYGTSPTIGEAKRLRNAWNAKFAGKPALATLREDGYLVGNLLGSKYLAHRVLWAMAHGDWPKDQIDHINGIRHDNRDVNLRDVAAFDNQRNMSLQAGSISGVNGVSFDQFRGKWKAAIGDSGETINLGRYDTMEEAISARLSAEREYGYHENHGRLRSVK